MKNRTALLALIAAATIWGAGVALCKVSMSWLGPYWLITGRFVIAAAVLGLVGRKHLRTALNWKVALNGALGYGLAQIFQDIGIAHTSVSHASILVGAVPLVVAFVALGMGHARPAKSTWLGYGVALLGIVLVAGGGGGGATMFGDTLMLLSVILSGIFMGAQPVVLAKSQPAAVTAVQFLVGAAVALPIALIHSGLPHAPASSGPLVAFAVLALVGTVLPFWLFAYGQTHVSADLAGAFLNIEPLVGAMIGWSFFSDPFGSVQVFGALAVVAGILLSVVHWGSVRIPQPLPMLERLRLRPALAIAADADADPVDVATEY
jgi:O-acetylserine/cysteine efflux transporter